MAEPIVNPELPFVGDVPSGLQPGKMLRFQGVTHPDSDRFNINLATGPNAKPRDDTALHMSVRLNQGYIARNTYKDGSWGDEQGSGKLPIGLAEHFEIIILVDPKQYMIAVNGQHFCEFRHIVPLEDVTHLLIDGDVTITLISFEGIAGVGGSEVSSQASQVNAEGPQGPPPPQFGGPHYGNPPPGAYGAPPPNYGGYGPPPAPGAEPQSQLGGIWEQAQEILAGAIKSGAAEQLLSSILHKNDQPQQPQGQGYAPQNAQYGIYPSLPQQDQSSHGGGSDVLSGILSSLISPNQSQQPQQYSQQSQAHQQEKGPMESLLSGLLSGGGQQHQQQPHGPQVGGEGSVGGLGSMGGLLGSLAGSFLNRQGHN